MVPRLSWVIPASWLPLATGARFTQPRVHFLADPCSYSTTCMTRGCDISILSYSLFERKSFTSYSCIGHVDLLCASLSLRQSGTANAVLFFFQDWGDAELGWHQFTGVFSPFSPFQLFPLQCKIRVKSRSRATYTKQAFCQHLCDKV